MILSPCLVQAPGELAFEKLQQFSQSVLGEAFDADALISMNGTVAGRTRSLQQVLDGRVARQDARACDQSAAIC